MIGKIERVPLREVWPHESLDFTPWLQENIDVLNDTLGLKLDNPERERNVGSFSVDLVAEDESSGAIIIENQLERSDHDHLGKIVTYLSSFGAKAAIWIVADPRPEHVNAIAWLNESSPADFYLVKLEAIKIEGSPPATLLTQIVGPSEEARLVGETKKDLAERQILRHKFWTGLLNKAKTRHDLFSRVSPSKDSWISAGSGKGILSYNYVIRRNDTRVEVSIWGGSTEDCKETFDKLKLNKEQIESEFGERLDWLRLENQRTSRIVKEIHKGGYRNDEVKWSEIHESMIETMIRLENAFKPLVANL